MRCFVAVELIPAVREPLLRLLRELPRSRDVRWCTEDQLHVTLKFLGEVGDAQIPQVCDAITAAAGPVAPFPIQLETLGCFPSPRGPRVLWCGIADRQGGCAHWVGLADPLFEELGFEREARAFTPHITLGRSRGSAGSTVLRQALEGAVLEASGEMTVDHVVLFESQLRPEGAQYTPIAKARLGG